MHFCNICIFNHNNITNINPLKSLLRFTENQKIEIKQIYSVSKQKGRKKVYQNYRNLPILIILN